MGARIMSLQEPDKKMSKSESENDFNVIRLLEEPETTMKKFKRAVTDSENEIRFDPTAKPGVSNLLMIYACVTGKDIPECEKEFSGSGYGTLKNTVGEAVVEMLRPIKKRYNDLTLDALYLDERIKANAGKAKAQAQVMISNVKKAIGLP